MKLDEASTLVESLRALPKREGRGFRFVTLRDGERFYPYALLEQEAQRRAGLLQRAGFRKGDRLVLLLSEGHEFVLAFLGAVMAGVVPVPMSPRPSFKAKESYRSNLAHVLRASDAKGLLSDRVTDEAVDLQGHVGEGARHKLGDEAVPSVQLLQTETLFGGDLLDGDLFRGHTRAPDAQAQAQAQAQEAQASAPYEAVSIEADDLCFLQFTSGSTSRPKGVQISHRNLLANARAFLGPEGLNRNDADVGVSWLPLFHDMGLIGFVLGTLVCDIPVVLLPTEGFARMPRRWLELISEHRGTITYAPNFAYQLVTKRARPKDVASLDLSCLRVAGCGAEPIRAQTLRAFSDAFAPAGFSPAAWVPSYGMAESTLAVTLHPIGTPWQSEWVDGVMLQRDRAERVDAGTEGSVELVACGRCFSGHELRILDASDRACMPGEVGEIVIRGPSVTAGYFRAEETNASLFVDGWMRTGDLGYLRDAFLYVCGRLKDLIIVRGANHHPQDIEWTVGDIEGVRRGNVVAFGSDRAGAEGQASEEALVIVAESMSAMAPALAQSIAEKVGQQHGLVPGQVVMVPQGTIPKTSSGKPQRRKTKQMFEEGALPRHEAT